MKAAVDKLTFFRQSGWMVLATVASGIFMTAVHVIVSKPMVPAEYSVFSTLLRVFLLMGFPAAGLQGVFAQQAAAALTEPARRSLSSQTRTVMRATFLIWLGLAAAVYLARNELITVLKISNPAALWVTLLLALVSLWAPIGRGLLQGRQQFASLGWVMILDGVGRFTAIVLIVHWGGQAAGAMTGALAGQLASLTVAAWLVRKILLGPGVAVQWRAWLRRVVPLTLGVGVVLFMCNFDVVYVQTIFAKEESKFYVPAAMIGLALVTFTTPLASVMFPKDRPECGGIRRDGRLAESAACHGCPRRRSRAGVHVLSFAAAAHHLLSQPDLLAISSARAVVCLGAPAADYGKRPHHESPRPRPIPSGAVGGCGGARLCLRADRPERFLALVRSR